MKYLPKSNGEAGWQRANCPTRSVNVVSMMVDPKSPARTNWTFARRSGRSGHPDDAGAARGETEATAPETHVVPAVVATLYDTGSVQSGATKRIPPLTSRCVDRSQGRAAVSASTPTVGSGAVYPRAGFSASMTMPGSSARARTVVAPIIASAVATVTSFGMETNRSVYSL